MVKIKSKKAPRNGSVVFMAMLLMVLLMVVLAFAIDLGYVSVTRTQLQRTADASAMAAAWELVAKAGDGVAARTRATATARAFARDNNVGSVAPSLGDEDVTIGYRWNVFDLNSQLDISFEQPSNTVAVTVRRSSGQNGEAPLFFARIMGHDSQAAEASATAAILTEFIGFRIPEGGDNLPLLPFALDQETWNELMDGNGTDNWTWNEATGQVEPGPDGILEANLYPQGTGSPGNRGTVDVGNPNNSTANLKRQVVDGVSPQDLSYHNDELVLNENGELLLNADTGISAGMKNHLDQIKGEGKIVPLFESVSGSGDNAQYRITGFAGVRVLEVELNGQTNNKRVIIQPADVIVRGGVPRPADSAVEDWVPSYFIYSPVVLVK
jgi:Flp pilus assembly protein TadG